MTNKSNSFRKIALIAFWGLFFLVFAPAPASAQFIGYTSPQSVQQTLAAAGTACTGAAQFFTASNLGQTQHYASITPANAPTNVSVQLFGSDSAGTQFPISDIGVTGIAQVGVTGSGYYPKVLVKVVCSPGTATFTLTYIGTSSTPNLTAGGIFNSQTDKIVFTALSGAAPQVYSFSSPFGSSSGSLAFQYASSAVGGSTLQVICSPSAFAASRTITFSIANTLNQQFFPVPPFNCPVAQVSYANGGAAGNIQIEYTFDPPGAPVNTTLGSYTHVTTTTATAAKATAGTLVGLTVNTPAAGTISIFDLATAACTGTPATNIVAVITATATQPPPTFTYNVAMLNGICVKASVAMDFTVSTQ